jgi:ABC-type transport system involved in multi-copper enzyme maturation permease subunit
VNGVVDALLGPLAAPECRRALSRGWVLVARVLAGIPAMIVALVVLWIWWFFRMFDRSFQPHNTLVGGLAALEWIMIVAAMLLSPAMTAGTLAGERARGVLPLLLASSVSGREIVTGRLAGRIALVTMLLLASLPGTCLLAGLAALPISVLLVLFLMPISVAIGAGGISLLASALSRRARDALMAVYLVQLVLFLVPILAWNLLPPFVWDVIGPVNPFYSVGTLVQSITLVPALETCGIWAGIGLAGTWLSAWRLRAVYLKQADGGTTSKKFRHRERPPVGDDPMLWKEIHFERVGRFSRFAWWVGTIIFTVLSIATFGLVGTIVWSRWFVEDRSLSSWAVAQLELLVGSSALPLSWLIQWTIGLRAAVAIASEREHGTWDAILLSSLEGREIIRAKILGNLYSLKGFVGAAALVWTLAVVFQGMDLATYSARLTSTIAVGIFITAVGVWISLSSATATRAMTFTIGIWLIAAAGYAITAVMIVAVIALLLLLTWMAVNQAVLVSGGKFSGPPVPISFETGVTIARFLLYTGSALLFAVYCRYRFDRLAGRGRD